MRGQERQYSAYADTGAYYVGFEFYSTHRANSKANFEDAIKHYKKKHGHRARIKVISTSYNKEPIL